MRIGSQVLVLALGALSLCAARGTPIAESVGKKAPWFCHGLDCPHYTIAETLEELELRRYETGKWASTIVAGISYDVSVVTGFKRLFNYISGENEEKAKVNMTAPVRVKLIPGDGPFCTSNFTVSFFVPFEHQSNPPEPTNSDVFIEEVAAAEYWVSSYGGFDIGPMIAKRAADIVDRLEKADKPHSVAEYYTAGYDPPFRLTKRHNEIWIPSSSPPVAE